MTRQLPKLASLPTSATGADPHPSASSRITCFVTCTRHCGVLQTTPLRWPSNMNFRATPYWRMSTSFLMYTLLTCGNGCLSGGVASPVHVAPGREVLFLPWGLLSIDPRDSCQSSSPHDSFMGVDRIVRSSTSCFTILLTCFGAAIHHSFCAKGATGRRIFFPILSPYGVFPCSPSPSHRDPQGSVVPSLFLACRTVLIFAFRPFSSHSASPLPGLCHLLTCS